MRSFLACISILIVLGFSACNQSDVTASPEGAKPDLRFEVEHGWPSLPVGRTLGLLTAVELDSHDHVFTFHGFRDWQEPFLEQPATEPLILMWDSSDGTLLDSWGAGVFLMPHGLSIDDNDNIWVTDVGLNQVLKFSHDGELLLALGEERVEGWDETHFAQPTDVEFGPDGTVYVSDGYVNCRVATFDPDGQFQFEWGECGSDPGQFNIPHDLTIDHKGRVYVADRENDRVQVFESNGEFITEWPSGGRWRPYGLSISLADEILFVVDGGEQPPDYPDRSGVVLLDLFGNELANFGRFGNQDGQLMMGHDITVRHDGNVYVVDVYGRRLQRFSRH